MITLLNHLLSANRYTEPRSSPGQLVLVHLMLPEGLRPFDEGKAQHREGVARGGLLEGKHIKLPVVDLGENQRELQM